jgi:hypothetical protein
VPSSMSLAHETSFGLMVVGMAVSQDAR